MKKHEFEGYKLFLQATNKRDSYNHVMVKYTFLNPDKEIIFKGEDFGASPLHSPEGKESAISLLGFLTLQKGDTDDEYFDNYTPIQIEFSESQDCENLRLIVDDFENQKDK